ncbi:MAG: SOS response-associated peptidase [Acidobacteriaceae bacterium]|jgi:putative SOS response-associated peptidase YedK
MCGRYLRRSDKQRIAEAFEVSKGLADLVLPPWDYNVAPTTFQPVIRPAVDSGHDTGERELALMRWGLVPYFATDLKRFSYSTINARAESLTTSSIFRTPFERRRCLVPADGFYEWKVLPTPTLFGPDPTLKSANKKGVAEKQPYAFTLASGEPFAFAGLWDRWRDPAGGTLESFSIITTTPNELTATVHDRMPVILRPQDYDRWLRRSSQEQTAPLELLALLRPYPADQMAAHEAHPDVGNVRNNHPGLLNSA